MLMVAAGVLPIQDALTATAWAEQPSRGQPGWGLGLYSQPDSRGIELGMVLAKPSSHGRGALRYSNELSSIKTTAS